MAYEGMRWRKVTDIKRKFASFELVDNDGDVVLDVGYSDCEEFEIAFGAKIKFMIFSYEEFFRIIELGRKLCIDDK